jgi:hypothetical protein
VIGQLRKSVFTKTLWGLMGLYLLNISVDSPDPNPEYIPEDLSINDQESIIEVVVEKILGFEDAFEEYDDHDSEDHNKKKLVEIDVFAQQIIVSITKESIIETIKEQFTDYNPYLTSGFQKLDTPPPKT